MTSTEGASPSMPQTSVALEGGDSPVRGLAALDPHREFMRFCEVCESEQRFVAQFELGNGLWGCCTTCGDERVVPYTRTVIE